VSVLSTNGLQKLQALVMREFIAIGDVQGFWLLPRGVSRLFASCFLFNDQTVETTKMPFGVVLKNQPRVCWPKARSTAYKLVRTMWVTLNLI
jgi:hypothetical protein